VRRALLGVVTALVLMAASAACTSQDGASSDSSASHERSTPESEPGEAESSVGSDRTGTFVALLELVDEGAWDGTSVHLADWSAVADVAEVDPPGDVREVHPWLLELTNAAGFVFPGSISWLSYPDRQDEVEAALGIHLGQVDASILAGAPPEDRTALIGTFDPTTVQQTVRADAEWSAELELVGEGASAFYSWDDEPDVIGRPSAARPLGRGGNLFVTSDELLWVHSRRVMEQMIRAGRDGSSLAANDDLRLAAQTLDDHGAYIGLLADGAELSGDGEPLLAPYQVLAVGNVLTTSEHTGLIVLVNDDDDAAEENVGRLRAVLDEGEPRTDDDSWDDLLDVTDVKATGRLTIALVDLERSASPSLLVDALWRGETLYHHDG
jgi:hypothetical protein